MNGKIREDVSEQFDLFWCPLFVKSLFLVNEAESLIFDEEEGFALEYRLYIYEMLLILSKTIVTSYSREMPWLLQYKTKTQVKILNSPNTKDSALSSSL